MPRTLYGDNGVTDANGDDANEGIMRRGSGNGRRISNEKTAFLTPTTTWAIITTVAAHFVPVLTHRRAATAAF